MLYASDAFPQNGEVSLRNFLLAPPGSFLRARVYRTSPHVILLLTPLFIIIFYF